MFFIAPCILKAAPKLAFFNPKALIGQKSRKQAYYSFLFFFFWLHWVFIPAHRLSQVAMNRICSLLRWAGFSLWWLLLLPSTGSRHTGFSVCSTEPHQLWSVGPRVCGLPQLQLAGSRAQAQQLWHLGLAAHSMCNLLGPRIKPMSPALAGRFLSTMPPGKSFSIYS